MIKEAKCPCGNMDVKKFQEYDGILGYEAIICLVCGRYFDLYGEHQKDEFSEYYINKGE